MLLGFFSKTMEGKSTSGRTTISDPPIKPIRTDVGSIYSADLSAYKLACERDPDLKSFDSSLHRRANRAINSLAAGAGSQSLSFDSLIEVSGCLLEMNQEVVRFIIESKEDVWNNKDLNSLVNVFFESSIKTLDFCNAVENCVKRARISQLIIQFALKQFETDSREGAVGNKFVKTLEELEKFKAAGDPFNEDFYILFESVYDQQVLLLEELHKQKRKLDKKMKNIKTWRKVSNVVFVTAFVSVLIFSVVAAAVAAPPVVTAVAGALAVPIGTVGKWCSYLWKKYENAVKGQKDIVLSMKIGAYVTMKDMENIRLHVDKLKIEIESMLSKVDFALKEEEEEVAVRLAIHEICKKLDVFTERIEEVGENAAKCTKDITLARTIVLRHILSYPSGSNSEQGNWIEAVAL